MESSLLTIITLLPLVGAIALLLVGRGERPNENAMRWTALVFTLATFALSLLIPIGFRAGGGLQFVIDRPWISAFDLGVRYHMGWTV